MTPEALVIESLFRVPDKHSREDIPFKLNSAQISIDGEVERLTASHAPVWIVVPKARQEGVSFYWTARKLVRCLHKKNTRVAIISHDTEATQKHLERVNYLLEHMQYDVKAVIDTRNKNEITFPKTGSTIYVGTAGARVFGRGDTLTDVLGTEVAFWPDAKKLVTGLINAVPRGSGEVTWESTGNGQGNWFHRRCMNAYKGQAPESIVFLPWHTFPEYTYSAVSPAVAEATMNNLNEDWGEPQLVQDFGLDAGRILWRRNEISIHDFDIRKVNQEYPSRLEDCFQASGYSLFHLVPYQETSRWERRSQFLWALEGHPKEGCRYVIGADVSAGVGKDSSVGEVFCLDTGEQVGEWLSNSTAPDVFATHLEGLGREFNMAYEAVEANNHGILTISELEKCYPRHLIHYADSGLNSNKSDDISQLAGAGFRTSRRSKPYLVGALRMGLSRKELLLHSPVLKDELSTFIEHEDGSLGAEEGCNDDTVIAAALACYVRDHASVVLTVPKPRLQRPAEQGFSVDQMIEELTGRNNQLPISHQDGVDHGYIY